MVWSSYRGQKKFLFIPFSLVIVLFCAIGLSACIVTRTENKDNRIDLESPTYSLENTTVSWTPVTDAFGYKVVVFATVTVTAFGNTNSTNIEWKKEFDTNTFSCNLSELGVSNNYSVLGVPSGTQLKLYVIALGGEKKVGKSSFQVWNDSPSRNEDYVTWTKA